MLSRKKYPFDCFSIKVVQFASEKVFRHLPMEISRAWKILLDRGGELRVTIIGTHHLKLHATSPPDLLVILQETTCC